MNPSSRTPEGDEYRCPVCGDRGRIEPSWPRRDATCPSCGCLLWIGDTSRLPSIVQCHVPAHTLVHSHDQRKPKKLRLLLMIVVMLAVVGGGWVTVVSDIYGVYLPEYLALVVLTVLLFGRRLPDIGYWLGKKIVSSG